MQWPGCSYGEVAAVVAGQETWTTAILLSKFIPLAWARCTHFPRTPPNPGLAFSHGRRATFALFAVLLIESQQRCLSRTEPNFAILWRAQLACPAASISPHDFLVLTFWASHPPPAPSPPQKATPLINDKFRRPSSQPMP
jgi:hypothetical protein